MRVLGLGLRVLWVSALLAASVFAVFGQTQPPISTQELSPLEGIPVLIKHLPEWESKKKTAKFFSDEERFREYFKEKPIIQKVEFFPGTEAVFADYKEGSLLIVEYTTPQASVEVDKIVLATEPAGSYVYRRIGNYNVFLFDPPDPVDTVAADALFEQIEYQKIVTWPYGDPTGFFQKERDFIVGAKSLFINTVIFILIWVALAIMLGVVLGLLYFRSSVRRRASMAAFSDAGGLTRLNLDGLSVDLPIKNSIDE
jgi:hypothetical protein